MNRLTRRLLLAVLLGVVVYGGFVAYTGYENLQQSLRSFSGWAFLAALALSTLNYFLRFCKWEYYLKRLQITGVSTPDSALVFLSGFVLTVTPGKVGEVFKSAVLARTHHIAMHRTAPIIVAERLTDVIGVLALIALGSLGFDGGLPWALAGIVVVVLCLVLILWRRPMAFAIAWLASRRGRLADLSVKLHHAFENLRIVAGPRALLWPACLSMVAWGLEGIALVLLIRGFSEAVPIELGVFFYSTATLAGALIPVPGGLGVVEAMLMEQLVRLGQIPTAAATGSMILVRFATLWWAVLLGFLALFAMRVRYPRLTHAEADAIVSTEVRANTGS